jgi:hypothetical protein
LLFSIEFWRLVVKRTNEYALWEKEFGERQLYDKWYPTDLQEMMRFFSLLLRMTMHPTPGRPFDLAWSQFKSYMPLGRFKMLRSAFYFSVC